jgi:hypothetical protein
MLYVHSERLFRRRAPFPQRVFRRVGKRVCEEKQSYRLRGLRGQGSRPACYTLKQHFIFIVFLNNPVKIKPIP